MSDRATRILLVIGAGAAATVALAAPGTLAALAAPSSLAPVIAHNAGMLAGYGAAVMLVMMSRWPLLENAVGADRLARWHATGGRTFLVLALMHAIAAVQGWAQVRRIAVLPALAEVLGMPGLIAATVATALFLFVAAMSIRAARRRMSYERWHLTHLSVYAAVGLSFGHELAGPDVAGNRAAQITLSLLYVYAYVLVLRYRVISPVWQAFRHRMRVVRVSREADGVVSIVVRGRRLGELSPRPGQFFRWRFLTARTWQSAHPFSLSAPPIGEFLRLTVKELGPGSACLQRIRPGVRVVTEGPYGAMTAERRTRPGVVLIAGGIGITPMRALFETIGAAPGRLTLIYRATSVRDIVFRAELDEIARRRGARVHYLVGPSSASANRMDAANLTRLVSDLRDRDVYLCASPRLAEAVREAVREAGVPRAQFHEEVFAF
ncbi:ferredoxin reductase family protein [Kutzneria kofuensis]|uniref:Putative ferric reductase n=1 Tax=Kutzneria kofuensis TaxID=103725 RepID=A0A7W9KPQ8_9PSEU|nr:ferredoxin reductase family protein [Kutzneria kofuensis]MBB5896382.1 putative ferric reductase [Kutzneria kofuensis]